MFFVVLGSTSGTYLFMHLHVEAFGMVSHISYVEVDSVSSSSRGQSVDLRRERACSRFVGDT